MRRNAAVDGVFVAYAHVWHDEHARDRSERRWDQVGRWEKTLSVGA